LRLLLNTHTFLWWLAGNEALPVTARAAIADEDNDVFVSAAAALPGPHRDPWDRIIMMAQALAEHCHMVTIDSVFAD